MAIGLGPRKQLILHGLNSEGPEPVLNHLTSLLEGSLYYRQQEASRNHKNKGGKKPCKIVRVAQRKMPTLGGKTSNVWDLPSGHWELLSMAAESNCQVWKLVRDGGLTRRERTAQMIRKYHFQWAQLVTSWNRDPLWQFLPTGSVEYQGSKTNSITRQIIRL